MSLKRILDPLKGERLPPGDAGLGGVRPEEAAGLPPGDAGLGGVRPEEAAGLPPGDAGLGGVRPEEAAGLPPGDAGLGGGVAIQEGGRGVPGQHVAQEDQAMTPDDRDPSEVFPSLSKLRDRDMTVLISDDDIRGRTVKDREGQDVGKVDALLVDDVEQKVRFMEVATGGFLGLGASKSLIPIEAITRITAGEVHISHTREHVAGAPPYDPQLTSIQEPGYQSSLYSYYSFGGGPAPWVTSWPNGQRRGDDTD